MSVLIIRKFIPCRTARQVIRLTAMENAVGVVVVVAVAIVRWEGHKGGGERRDRGNKGVLGGGCGGCVAQWVWNGRGHVAIAEPPILKGNTKNVHPIKHT